MSKTFLSRWLKFIIILSICFSTAVYLLPFPFIVYPILKYSSAEKELWIWLGLIWSTAVPIYIALTFSWRIASNIGKGRMLSLSTAKSLRIISVLAAADVAWFFIAGLILLLFEINLPIMVIGSFFIVIIGVVISAAAAVLSHLVKTAAKQRHAGIYRSMIRVKQRG